MLGANDRRRVTGRITVLQEERFRMVTDDGKGLLLSLDHRAFATVDDLCAFHNANTHVTVIYEGEANLESGLAMSVEAAQ